MTTDREIETPEERALRRADELWAIVKDLRERLYQEYGAYQSQDAQEQIDAGIDQALRDKFSPQPGR
jgi:hypothetical protein